MATTNSLTQFSDDLAGLAEKAGETVVRVNARRRMAASGFLYTNELVITANHVVQREEAISIELAGGEKIPATLAGRDPARDLALLRLEKGGGKAATPASTGAKAGQLALALARPDPGEVQASLGMVMAVSGPVHSGRGAMLEAIIRTDIVPYPGFSGGPLIDMHGNILGLNTSGLAMGNLITIPAGSIWEAAGTLESHGRIPHAYLGVRSQPVELAPAQQTTLGREQPSALLLVGIEADTPAQKAGLLTGDILAGLSGKALHDPEELQMALGSQPVNSEGSLEILRGERRIELKVRFGERPSE